MPKKKEYNLRNEAVTATNWKRTLKEIYDFAPNNWGESNKISKYEDRHPLAKKLKIRGQELGNTISFLEDQKLIKTNISNPKDYAAQWIITEKGFNVVQEIQRERMNAFQQTSIIFLTFVLALTSFFEFIPKSQDSKLFIWYIVSLLVGMSLTTWVFRRSIK